MPLFALVLGAAFVVALGMASLERLPLDQPVMSGVDSGYTSETTEVHLPKSHRKGPRYQVNRNRFVGACLVLIAAGLIAIVAWGLWVSYQP